jgi:hypothetical protein
LRPIRCSGVLSGCLARRYMARSASVLDPRRRRARCCRIAQSAHVSWENHGRWIFAMWTCARWRMPSLSETLSGALGMRCKAQYYLPAPAGLAPRGKGRTVCGLFWLRQRLPRRVQRRAELIAST